METHAPTWRKLLLPGGFALVCILLTVGIWVSFGGTVPFAPAGYRFSLELPEATNIYEYTSVRVAGVTVGKVVSVSRSGRDGAQALIQMSPEFSPIHADATAIVRSKTLLGEGYIEIFPGARAAPAIPDGGRLSASHVLHTQQLYDVLRTFTPATRAHIRSLFAGLARTISGRSGSLGTSISNLAPTTASLTTVAETLDAQSSSVQTLLSDSGTVFSALGTREGDLQAAVNAGNTVLHITATQRQELELTVRALPPFLTRLTSASNTLTAASGDLGSAANALLSATPNLVPAVNEITAAAPTFRTLFNRLPSTISAGDRGLPALTRILHTAKPSLAAVLRGLQQLTPILQLGSASRAAIIGTFANVGQILNGVETGQNGVLSHFGSGVVSLWNETLGGWKVKLPTNRDNAYPKPNEALDIAHGGLEAYDCRNTGNPLYIPPTGTGAPTCKLQGPWTFDGKTAYYPRLQPTPP